LAAETALKLLGSSEIVISNRSDGIPCCLLAIILLVLAFGCSGKRQANYATLELVDAGGTITLDGEPLADAAVTFQDSSGRYSFGKTNDDGEYTLMYNSEQPGVTEGKKTVRVSTRHTVSEEGVPAEEEGSETHAPGVELVPVRYNANSELTVVVDADRRVYSFDLTTQ
jgi:hypothetical protein